MATFEFNFGATRCAIETAAHPSSTSDAAYTAAGFIVENDGRDLRPIADGASAPVEFPASTEADAVQRLSDYLVARLGSRSGALPVNTTIGRPVLKDVFDRWFVRATNVIHGGQLVLFSPRGTAEGVNQITGIGRGQRLGVALQDIGKDAQGWIRETPKKDG
jgi:hypothetical protein